MDEAPPYPRIGVYADPWRTGRYCVKLTGELQADLESAGAVLEDLGYELVDQDQWGQSYGRGERLEHTVAINEQEHDSAGLDLLLQEADLLPEAVAQVADELAGLYRTIRAWVEARHPPDSYGADWPGEGAGIQRREAWDARYPCQR